MLVNKAKALTAMDRTSVSADDFFKARCFCSAGGESGCEDFTEQNNVGFVDFYDARSRSLKEAEGDLAYEAELFVGLRQDFYGHDYSFWIQSENLRVLKGIVALREPIECQLYMRGGSSRLFERFG